MTSNETLKVDIRHIVTLQRERRFDRGAPSLEQRTERLRALRTSIEVRSDAIFSALANDLGKPRAEAMMDIGGPLQEIDTALAGLAQWVLPQPVSLGSHAAAGASAEILFEPKGSILIFGPWNFPFALLMQPLAAAIAAGNSCVLKPSELAPATAAICAEIIGQVFDEAEAFVFQGGPDVAEALLAERFDHIFFTGSTHIGRKVMSAAAQHLSSVTLELGGKCPVIIDRLEDLATAAQRVGRGKYLNAGQVCLAPDHVWIAEEQRDAFTAHMVHFISSSYYLDGVLNRCDSTQIVTEQHLARCLSLVDDAVARGARILHGGGSTGHYMEPTVLVDVPLDCVMMQEEIFGPILPILTYTEIDPILARLERSEAPLGLYVFSDRDEFIERIIASTVSGGVTVNDVMQHASEPALPFGGVGASGLGAYHGYHSFVELSHRRSVYRQASATCRSPLPSRPASYSHAEAIARDEASQEIM